MSSFSTFFPFSKVKTIIVFLSEELYDLAAVRDMVRAMHELGKVPDGSWEFRYELSHKPGASSISLHPFT